MYTGTVSLLAIKKDFDKIFGIGVPLRCTYLIAIFSYPHSGLADEDD
jgi:hypothetical protein